jgi:hypothetical protein
MGLKARTMHVKDPPLAFSPGMQRGVERGGERDPREVDGLEEGRRWKVRYLVAWLPWLSLLGYFRDQNLGEGGRGGVCIVGCRRGWRLSLHGRRVVIASLERAWRERVAVKVW